MDSANLDTPPATPSPPVSTESGRVIAARYRLIKKLGEGAMGAVFLAEHIHMRKRFALKILLPEAMASPEIVARFEREAIAAGNIEHPGVCAATDFGRLDDGGFFLVLEYVDGNSLRSIIRDGGAMPPARATGIVRQILSALAAAHAKGVVHRDMKPENVMITSGPTGDDVVKVLDFGIAKVDANTLGEGQGTNLTRMGAIYGTPVYMAPEQAMGKAIDARVDLYAVGVMLHEMITGKPPFDGDGIVLLAKHVNDEPPKLVSPLDPNAVSAELRGFAERLLAKDPKDRPEDANRAIAELDTARATLSSFHPIAIGTNPTVMGETSILSARPGAIADAATVFGDQSPPPPSVATRAAPSFPDRLRTLRDRALVKLTPLAKRAGIDVKHLAIGIACLAGMLVLVLMVVAFSGGKSADEEEDERRPRKRPIATSQSQAPTSTATSPKEDDPSKSGSGASPAGSSSSGKGGGGGIKGLGRKIKSLF